MRKSALNLAGKSRLVGANNYHCFLYQLPSTYVQCKICVGLQGLGYDRGKNSIGSQKKRFAALKTNF